MKTNTSGYWGRMRQEVVRLAKKRAYDVAIKNNATEESARRYAERAWQAYTEEVAQDALFGEEE